MTTCACGNIADRNGTTCRRCAALHELGLEPEATDSEVKTAYHLYVKAWHPDRFMADEKSKSVAQEKLKAINSAYDFLTAPSSRKGQAYRPKASAAPSPPKPNTGGQAPPPKPSATRRWGIFIVLFAGRLKRAPRWSWTGPAIALLVLAFATLTIVRSNRQRNAAVDHDALAKKYGGPILAPKGLTQDDRASSGKPSGPPETLPADSNGWDAGPPAKIVVIEQQAEALDKQNRYSEAAPLFNQACAGGDGEGCDHLGSIYFHGGAGTKDYLTAAAFFTKACDAGNSDGCENLGGMYELGEGFALDHAKAAALWSKACDAGNTNGCNDLGHLYDEGTGVRRDYQRAAALFSKACDSGRTLGCHNLGIMYREGRGVAKDIEKAKLYFNRGCAIGLALSCDALKEMQ